MGVYIVNVNVVVRFIHLRLGVPTLGTSGGSTVLCCAVFLSGLLNIAHGGNPIYGGVYCKCKCSRAIYPPKAWRSLFVYTWWLGWVGLVTL